MKKSVFAIALFLGLSSGAFSQQVLSSSSGSYNPNLGNFSNEVKVNFLNLIVLGSVEVGYERYLSDDHSLDLQILLNDRFGYNSESGDKKYKTNSVQASMNFYFGDNTNGRFFLYPLAKVRFGDFEESIDGSIVTTDMTAFIFGAGAGYKWEVSSNFAFGPYVSIARGFSNSVADRFTRVELNGGFSLGYRF